MNETELSVSASRAPESLMTFDEVISEIARGLNILKILAANTLDRDFEGKKKMIAMTEELDLLYRRAEELADAS